VPFRLSVARWPCQFWADYTTNISEHKFPTGTGQRSYAIKLPQEFSCRRAGLDYAAGGSSSILIYGWSVFFWGDGRSGEVQSCRLRGRAPILFWYHAYRRPHLFHSGTKLAVDPSRPWTALRA